MESRSSSSDLGGPAASQLSRIRGGRLLALARAADDRLPDGASRRDVVSDPECECEPVMSVAATAARRSLDDGIELEQAVDCGDQLVGLPLAGLLGEAPGAELALDPHRERGGAETLRGRHPVLE